MSNIYDLAKKLGETLFKHKLKCTTAESCTGGEVSAAITNVEGSSAWFERGFITYSNEAKQSMLGVPALTISTYGAVSEETARAMAKGALAHSEADLSVAITGIAGPTGGSANKPVGTVWIAWADQTAIQAHGYHFKGDRAAIRQQSVLAALAGLLQQTKLYALK